MSGYCLVSKICPYCGKNNEDCSKTITGEWCYLEEKV